MRGLLWRSLLLACVAIACSARVVLAAPLGQGEAGVQITAPTAAEPVRGAVTITGSAALEDFSFYKVEYGAGASPVAWTLVGSEHTAPVTAGTLEVWDTAALDDGPYTVRLHVVRLDGNFAETQVSVTVNNAAPTATPAPAIATPLAPTAVGEAITAETPAAAEAITATVEPPATVTPMPPVALGNAWSTPINVSDTSNGSWFPDLAVDDQGRLHITWCETETVYRAHIEKVFYRIWDGVTWSASNDIVPPSADIIRHAIAVDRSGNLHLLFGGSPYSSMPYTQLHSFAPLASAASAAAWSTPQRISDAASYMGDIKIDSHNTIHTVFDQQVQSIIEVQGKEYPLSPSDVYYRRSTDGGDTWTTPLNLFPSQATGSARAHLEVDRRDTLHLTWDEGWDRFTGEGVPSYGVYRASTDGGLSWSEPFTPTTVITDAAQLTPGADDRGGVMLVWRSAGTSALYYRWSPDGVAWNEPALLPGGLYARPWSQGNFDRYHMATDSAGRIHLALVAGTSPTFDAALALYHLAWDGQAWSAPEVVYSGPLYPEYPRLEVGLGNQLHLVWFTRTNLYNEERRDVWYSGKLLDCPEQGPVSVITPTPWPSPTPTATPSATLTPYPTLAPGSSGLPYAPNSEAQLLRGLLLGLLPVAGLIVLVAVFYRLRRNRRG
jgi:hypothetical protein